MKQEFLWINVGCYVVIALYLVIALATSLASGYPWSLTCYSCASCRQTCPLGIDPKGFVMAALSADPELYITAGNIRLRLGTAFELDPEMVVSLPDESPMTAGIALSEGQSPEHEVLSVRIQAKHAARYCPVCGNCAKNCPVNLPIIAIIEDLKDNGEFNRR